MKVDRNPENPYNQIPVYFCTHCLSLAIRRVEDTEDSLSYCDKCGSIKIKQASIYDWEELVKLKEKRQTEILLLKK